MFFLQKKNILRNHASIWIMGFIVMSFIVRGTGESNGAARYAYFQSVIEQQTFAIDSFKQWTGDWSTSPSGKTYSNKPPGPLFLTLPVYYVFDKITKLSGNRSYNKNGIVTNDIGGTAKVFFNFLTKVLPFSLLILFISFSMQQKGYSAASIHFFAITSLFGTTASIFMNACFGHGMASIMFLGMLWSWMEKKYRLVGFLYGFTLLTDFAGGAVLAVLIPFLVFQNYKNPKNLVNFAIGGIIPGILWCWYHISCYGSPFLTSINFPNPEFVFSSDTKAQVSGMFTLLPRWKIVGELIYGPARGILVTQPWVLFLIPFIFILKFEKKFFAVFAILTLSVLLWLNSTFFGWHAGGSTGPRYLSIGLALMPIAGFLVYDKLAVWVKYSLWMAVGITLLFRSQTYATYMLIANTNLWEWQWGHIVNSTSSKTWFRLVISSSFFIFAAIYTYRKNKVT